MQMHKKVISFNDIFALGDIKPQDRPAVLKKLKEYRQMLEGISEDTKNTAQYKELMQKITEITKELGVGQVIAEFIRINPGTFIMGEKDQGNNPPHKVTITRPFEISQYQVTQAEFLEFKKDHEFGFPGHAKNPAEQVTWDEAVEYCKWLSLLADDIEQSHKDAIKSLKPEKYINYAFEHHEARLYRLPTEAEWEYACRNEGRSIPDEMAKGLKQYAVYDREKPGPVGSKKPNQLGLYDMLGNVWEWCIDVYEKNISKNTENDPCNFKKGQNRVLRGGSWDLYDSKYLRPSYRYNYDACIRDDNYGFRPARTVE
jgi:sulfatase modifying factor 1